MNHISKELHVAEVRRRVCMLAYTSYETDGRVRMEAEALVRLGYDVCFLVLKVGRHPRRYSLGGVNIIELNVLKYRGKNKARYLLSYLRFLVLACLQCTVLFVRSGVRVIHVHNMPDVLVFAAIIPRLLGCKVVLDIHDTIPETYAAKFAGHSGILVRVLGVEESLSCAVAHKVIAVNHVQREVIIARGVPAKKVSTVITMPVFVGRQLDKGADEMQQRFRLVNHGTVSKRLGIDLLIRASALMAREIPGFELYIIGGGDDLEEMVKLSGTLGLSERIHFRKPVAWNMLPQELCKMDAGIVANRANICTHLMLPSKLIDYVSLDIPVVVPKLKAIEYYFTKDMVSYFESENMQSMASAVIGLYASSERRRQKAANARSFLEKYSWSKTGDLRDLYAELFEHRKPSALVSQASSTDYET
jgi:glycosyltransferase involved in cell wall biosynthesis